LGALARSGSPQHGDPHWACGHHFPAPSRAPPGWKHDPVYPRPEASNRLVVGGGPPTSYAPGP
jgi:hypothetical protein